MQSLQKVSIIGLAVLLPLALGQGCPGELAGAGTDPVVDAGKLTDAECQALVAAVNAPGGVAQATDVTKSSTGNLTGDNFQMLPSDLTFGSCPEVTASGSLTEAALELSVDFGQEPCAVLTVSDDFSYVCSGLATGSFDLVGGAIELAFENIDCNDQRLDGTASVSFEMLASGGALEGAWDLTWSPGAEAITTTGSGNVIYEPSSGECCDVTSVETFTGSVTTGEHECSVSMSDILMSLEAYQSLIPYSGSITLGGANVRTIIITFDENSPVTGDVTVAIENSQTLTVNLFELDSWQTMFPED